MRSITTLAAIMAAGTVSMLVLPAIASVHAALSML
jgi:hypothetical protein